MAERRMFAKTIVLSDAFLDLPMSARCLYFTLSMLADDDGFINNPKSIMRQCGASLDDMNILLAKKFVLDFDSGVIVIKHWRIHNYIQKDRYKETKYIEEKSALALDQNGAYTKCIQPVSTMDTQDSLELGEASLEKELLGKVSAEKWYDCRTTDGDRSPSVAVSEEEKDEEGDYKKKSVKGTSPTLFDKLIGNYTFSDALKAKMAEWITYKTEKRQTYKERGMASLLTQVETRAKKYGDHAVCELIDECMANNWNGIIWERLEKKQAAGNQRGGIDFHELWDRERSGG